MLGTWWLTDRLLLDDDDEVADLAEALELSTDDTDRLRRNLAAQLADVLYGATDCRPPGSAGADAGDRRLAAPAEPPLLARLREAGFVDYQLPDGVDGDVVRLPASGLRIVVVVGPRRVGAAGRRARCRCSTDLTADGPVPVVAVQPHGRPGGSDDGDDPPADRSSTVDP